jgi:hypothetical protein
VFDDMEQVLGVVDAPADHGALPEGIAEFLREHLNALLDALESHAAEERARCGALRKGRR